MSPKDSLMVPWRVMALAVLVATAPRTAGAQASPTDGDELPRVRAEAPSDFMLGRPRGFLAFDGGRLFANTGSDLYDFITDTLTVERKAFDSTVLGGRFGLALGPRLEVIAGLEHGRTTSPSEYRDFVDNQLLPITQTTSREEWLVSASLRLALLPPGRRISRFAWIPRTFTPYVGLGAGALKYEFQQFGSFIDADTSRVFNDSFNSRGWTPSVHAFAGADLRVYRRIYLTGEARYTRSRATLGADFVDFEPLALAGTRVTGGVRLAF